MREQRLGATSRKQASAAISISGLFLAATLAGCGGSIADPGDEAIESSHSALSVVLKDNLANPTGRSASFSTAGAIDLGGTFFQSLGTNGRSCLTCHQPAQGWTVSAQGAQAVFDATGGTDPLFAADGQNCVGADRSTVAARRAASSLMLNRGVVRFFPKIPAAAEFEKIAAVGTNCNTLDATTLVIYRRPLPTANFGSLNTLFWDALGNAAFPSIDAGLAVIVTLATRIHAENPLFTASQGQVNDVLTLMKSVTTAQTFDNAAGDLTARHALGGPKNLATFALTGSRGFSIYNAWNGVPGGGTEGARRSVANGQQIFNTRPINITGVAGMHDRVGTCATCHGVPNMGNSSIVGTLATGVSDAANRPDDLPLYTLRNTTTGQIVQVSDPGHALVTGAWADIGKFKVPALRGLASRAPYFHNGIAATLEDSVEFYDARFNMGLDGPDEQDLINFLLTL
jgi:cytochrome c peroxidase